MILTGKRVKITRHRLEVLRKGLLTEQATMKSLCFVFFRPHATYPENGRRQHMASGASDESKPSLHILALYETQILYVEHRSFILAYMNKWSFFSTIRARNVYLFHPFHLQILRCNLMLWVLLFVKLRLTHHLAATATDTIMPTMLGHE